MTLKLCGFSASNYYNKIKLQLMEKDIPFVEELVWTGHTDSLLVDRSPMGKVPFLDTPQGPVSESGACAEYIEATYPQKPLLPADPYAAARYARSSSTANCTPNWWRAISTPRPSSAARCRTT